MEIARFTSATGWAGRSITYDDGRFSLQDFGPIAAAAVLEYDRAGQIEWAYAGLREWVQGIARRRDRPAAAGEPAGRAAGARKGMPAGRSC